MAKKSKLEKQFHTYIESRKILVADTKSSSRAGISRTLSNLGAKSGNITMANAYDVAEQELARIKPHVVICDYELGNRCGLELLQKQREEVPESKECIFVLVTGNTSQSAVAQAAEEDVDTFILKPYTIDQFRSLIMNATIAKIHPTEYRKTVEAGKSILFEGNFDEAMPIFEKAMTLDPKPALACFYMGQAQLMKKALEEAEGNYNGGLNYNKIHYKCIVGLFELLLDQKKHVEAYEIVKKIARYFPANPNRMTQILRLAIITKSYEDIERYYQTFTTIDVRNENLIKFICAALVVTGKFYLRTKYITRAQELFQKAGISAAGRPKILREIITALLEFDMPKDAEAYLKRFPADVQGKADFLAMKLGVEDRSVPATKTVESARAIVKEGIKDPFIYELLIKRSVECGLKDSAEEYFLEAKKEFPKAEAIFQKAMNPPEPSPEEAAQQAAEGDGPAEAKEA